MSSSSSASSLQKPPYLLLEPPPFGTVPNGTKANGTLTLPTFAQHSAPRPETLISSPSTSLPECFPPFPSSASSIDRVDLRRTRSPVAVDHAMVDQIESSELQGGLDVPKKLPRYRPEEKPESINSMPNEVQMLITDSLGHHECVACLRARTLQAQKVSTRRSLVQDESIKCDRCAELDQHAAENQTSHSPLLLLQPTADPDKNVSSLFRGSGTPVNIPSQPRTFESLRSPIGSVIPDYSFPVVVDLEEPPTVPLITKPLKKFVVKRKKDSVKRLGSSEPLNPKLRKSLREKKLGFLGEDIYVFQLKKKKKIQALDPDPQEGATSQRLPSPPPVASHPAPKSKSLANRFNALHFARRGRGRPRKSCYVDGVLQPPSEASLLPPQPPQTQNEEANSEAPTEFVQNPPLPSQLLVQKKRKGLGRPRLGFGRPGQLSLQGPHHLKLFSLHRGKVAPTASSLNPQPKRSVGRPKLLKRFARKPQPPKDHAPLLTHKIYETGVLNAADPFFSATVNTVVVPQFHIVGPLVRGIPSFEDSELVKGSKKTEDITDERYDRRHYRLEIDEAKRKALSWKQLSESSIPSTPRASSTLPLPSSSTTVASSNGVTPGLHPQTSSILHGSPSTPSAPLHGSLSSAPLNVAPSLTTFYPSVLWDDVTGACSLHVEVSGDLPLVAFGVPLPPQITTLKEFSISKIWRRKLLAKTAPLEGLNSSSLVPQPLQEEAGENLDGVHVSESRRSRTRVIKDVKDSKYNDYVVF